MSADNTQARAEYYRPLAERIIAAWMQELEKAGLQDCVALPLWQNAHCALERDPASGNDSLKASWRGKRNELLGSMVFHADGSFFGEYDVIRNHPRRKDWFVEAVSSWGRDEVVKSELRLLPLVE